MSPLVKKAFIVKSLTGSDVVSLAWQCCEDGGVQSHSAAAAVIVTVSLRLRLRLRLEGGQRPGRAAQPARPQSRRSRGQGCTCCRRRRWGLTASKGDRLEAVGGGGLPGGPDPPLSQTHLDQQPGRAGVPAGPQRGKRPPAELEGFPTGDGHLLGVSPRWLRSSPAVHMTLMQRWRHDGEVHTHTHTHWAITYIFLLL